MGLNVGYTSDVGVQKPKQPGESVQIIAAIIAQHRHGYYWKIRGGPETAGTANAVPLFFIL
ncbi:hypothetical protein WG68_08645 [Arsukibacterium ikkense]|uniref:Uncharacterized protein n=1 Tax=Arsukibacterium ikkense TaxID=336831 RepID=A0A0M2V5V6_9GAMM|nr:hypothetical protein WG68_08645 [Arsukibacterium ikkense]